MDLLFWFISANAINYVFHWSQYWQLNLMERQSGMIQLGTNLSFLCLFAIAGPVKSSDPIDEFLGIYPPFTLILATTLLAHGSIYMGRLLLAGFLFFPLAILIAFLPSWGPLLLGIGGALIIGVLDLKMQQLSGKPA